ncbi:MAG: nitroreductase family protein [Solirubrobacterales bacterium]|nr:nitroreductase family protein [Solirubrobacterales bacterium]
MDTFLAVASKREVREYAGRPIPADATQRILEAGRVAGSSRNRQPWRFVVVESPSLRERLAEAVHVSANVRGAALVVVVAVSGRGPTAFDAGRAAQNMMLTAWNDHIGSCPNGMTDPDAVAALLDLEEGEHPTIVLTFGYPAHTRDPFRREAVEWIERADRKPFDEVIQRL